MCLTPRAENPDLAPAPERNSTRATTPDEGSRRAARVGVLTATRAEYGLLRWLMRDIEQDPDLELQIYATGAHLAPEFGETWRDIEKDGFRIAARVPFPMGSGSRKELALGMGVCAQGAAEAFEALRPDALVVLGDRYELLPVCGAALVMDIPVAHISGGDITEGAIDDQIRHAVTKLAALHFPGSAESAARLLQMGEAPDRVVLVGELGLDGFTRVSRLDRAALAKDLGLDPKRPWALLTWHPETRADLEYNTQAARDIVSALLEAPEWSAPGDRHAGRLQCVVTYANADYGGREINEIMREAARRHPHDFIARENLGQVRYISMLHEAACMLGNSSSGIFESPSVKLPTLNIGDRQKGRFLTPNIVQCAATRAAVLQGLAALQRPEFREKNQNFESPYGDGRASEKVLGVLKSRLVPERLRELRRKPFVTLPELLPRGER